MTEVVGTARLGRRTKDLVKRLRPGDLAIIDHVDLDRVSAEELAESGVRAVVNVSPSTSGRFPNPGPLELVRAGVCLVDALGSGLFDELSDGETVTVRGGSVWRNGTRLAEGVELTEAALVGRARRPAEPGHRGARGVRRQHPASPARRGQAARRRDRVPAADRRGSATGTPSSSPAGRATRATSGSCGRTSGTSSRCSSPSTAARTRCSRSG